jgi:predicted phosphodiesterase
VIWLCGDVHGRFKHLIDAVLQSPPEQRPAAVILLGDLQAQQPLEVELAAILAHTEVWFIPGNHDTDSDADHDHLFGSALAGRNLHGLVVEIAGVRVAGLGGVFRGQVWMPPNPSEVETARGYVARAGRGNLWRGGLPRRHRSTIFPAEVQALSRQRADVLVTHEAPSCHPHGFAALDALARCLQVRQAFHGHHHDRRDYRPEWPRLGFEAHGVGLRGITALDGPVIRVGELDERRAIRGGYAAPPGCRLP